MRKLPQCRRIPATVTMVAVLATTVAGCSWPGTADPAGKIVPELTELRVGVTKAIDTVPLRLATQKGVFARAGLDLELVEQPNQQRSLDALDSGEVAVAFAGNIALFKKAAAGRQLQLQGEAYISGPNTMALVTLPGVGYDDPSEESEPTIAVEPDDDLGVLTTRSRLATEGIDPDRIIFARMSFTEMMTALSDHRVDAAWLTEPLISRAQKEYGARIVADTARGAMLNFPMSSYAARMDFASANPKTFTLFRTLLRRAQRLASDPSVVRGVLPTYAALDETSAALVALGTYPTALNSVRLQRVADLLHNSGVLAERLDVRSMVPPGVLPGG
ncbi:MAG: ABC transporter substrate-binding protein [Pseudonocardiaceae bacterium]